MRRTDNATLPAMLCGIMLGMLVTLAAVSLAVRYAPAFMLGNATAACMTGSR